MPAKPFRFSPHSKPAVAVASDALNNESSESERPSKTQRKQAMHALQALGEALMRQSPQVWAQCNLPQPLLTALQEGQSITAHEGLRRHKQWVGKLMRRVDPEPIRRVLASLAARGQSDSAQFHALERWRERLMTQPDALREYVDAHPGTDTRQLSALIREARLEQAQGKPPRAYRELFQWLKRQSPATSPGPDNPEQDARHLPNSTSQTQQA